MSSLLELQRELAEAVEDVEEITTQLKQFEYGVIDDTPYYTLSNSELRSLLKEKDDNVLQIELEIKLQRAEGTYHLKQLCSSLSTQLKIDTRVELDRNHVAEAKLLDILTNAATTYAKGATPEETEVRHRYVYLLLLVHSSPKLKEALREAVEDFVNTL